MNQVRVRMGAMVLLWRAILSIAVTLAALAAPGSAQAETTCPPAPLISLRLPHLRAAAAAGRELLIVALGSSSTQGAMASSPAHSYPAVLQALLARSLPDLHVAVINRGIGGQDAPEELARLQTDAIALHPQLVIWQVGANGAMRNADPVAFARRVTEGVQRLQAADIDVVLMDNQHCPKVDATPEGVLLDGVLGTIAKTTGAGLFSRAALMDSWQQAGVPMIEFISTDGLHHNDRGYGCVARALSADIVAALRRPNTLSAHR